MYVWLSNFRYEKIKMTKLQDKIIRIDIAHNLFITEVVPQ